MYYLLHLITCKKRLRRTKERKWRIRSEGGRGKQFSTNSAPTIHSVKQNNKKTDFFAPTLYKDSMPFIYNLLARWFLALPPHVRCVCFFCLCVFILLCGWHDKKLFNSSCDLYVREYSYYFFSFLYLPHRIVGSVGPNAKSALSCLWGASRRIPLWCFYVWRVQVLFRPHMQQSISHPGMQE